MARKQNSKHDASSSGVGEMDGNVDKIREILFGGQMRDYEQRFADLEKRLTLQIDRLSNDFDKRMERLNTFARREIDKLSEHLKAERKERIAEGKQGTKDLEGFTHQVEAWFGEVEEQFESETKDLRAILQEQSEELSALIAETRDSLGESLAQETRDLANKTVAPEDLAGLLTEVALRLKKDFKLPKA